MPLNKIPIDPAGGAVTVEIAFGFAQVGAYTLKLWYQSGQGKILGEGVNTDNKPDVFTLPKPVKSNIGRILDCVATVLSPNPKPGERYRVDMIVWQDGEECGREFDEGLIDRRSVSTRLAAILSEKA
ncbi:MAG TPA: hypothetical protein VNL69_02000 [Bacteroidota bacterium]|nr:hypothetical protein [Bacteroidota bacterium]